MGDAMMVLRATTPPLSDWVGWAVITNEVNAATGNQPTLLIDGRPVDPLEAEIAGYQIVDATVGEILLLQRGGYRIILVPA